MSRRGGVPAPDAGWAYFFDVDGTLAQIAPSPSAVRLEDELHRLVRRLHARTGGALALVSGRAIADVDAIFGEPRLPVAGQHGLERRDAQGTLTRHDADVEQIRAARERIAAVTARHAGLMLEEKGLSLALHYRAAPALSSYVHRVMRAVLAEIGPGFIIQSGKRVVELAPGGADKGSAVADFMNEAPFHGRTPLFVGDDATDERGFAMVNALGGHSVKVGRGATVARWRLADVGAVREWLASGA